MEVEIKTYQSDFEHNFGDKALLNLYDGWTIVEVRAKEVGGNWIFLNYPYGTSMQHFSKFHRPFDKKGVLLPIEMWESVCEELNADRTRLICNI